MDSGAIIKTRTVDLVSLRYIPHKAVRFGLRGSLTTADLKNIQLRPHTARDRHSQHDSFDQAWQIIRKASYEVCIHQCLVVCHKLPVIATD